MQQQQAQPAACALLVKRSAGAPESTRAQRSTNGVWAVLVGSFHCAPQAALGCRTLCRSVSRLGLSAGTACTGVLGVLTWATSVRRMLASAFPQVQPAVQCMLWPIRTVEYRSKPLGLSTCRPCRQSSATNPCPTTDAQRASRAGFRSDASQWAQ